MDIMAARIHMCWNANTEAGWTQIYMTSALDWAGVRFAAVGKSQRRDEFMIVMLTNDWGQILVFPAE